MHKIKTETDPAAFHTTFKIPAHSYPARFSSVNYSKPETIKNYRNYRRADSGYLYEVQPYGKILLL